MGELIQQPAEIGSIIALISLLVAIVLLRKQVNRHRTEIADKTQKLREFKNLIEENAASLSAMTADFEKAQTEINDKAVDLEKVLAEVEDKAKQLNEFKSVAKERDQIKAKYSGIIDVQQRLGELKTQLDGLTHQTEETRARYKKKRQWLSKLESELALYEDRFAWAKLGMYEPHFDFDHSDEYKEEIKDLRQRQRDMIQSEIAVQHLTQWTVNNSQAQGRKMMKRAERLTLRSFNNECETAINRVKWNNVNAMEERIRKAFKSINRYNASNELIIDEQYLDLKLEELRLTHEYQEKKKQEQEERQEKARAEREEKKLFEEAKKAEKEEARYQGLLEKARKEAGSDEQSEELRKKIKQLEADLADAHERTERAKSLAQITSSGFVYVISNVGSFGEDIVKIGMTRRVDPNDRVKELGDASVPFRFDTHALIYSDEAPTLESELHNEFKDRRVNMANYRKEFFRVSLDEVRGAVERLVPGANFFTDREAREYHETLAMRNEKLAQLNEQERFPDEI